MCFSLAWLAHILIWVVVIGAVVAIVRLLLPRVFSLFGDPGGLIFQIINIVIYAVILICIIYFAFDVISCLLSYSGGSVFPRH